MDRARRDAPGLQPLTASDDDAAEIAAENERWSRIADALLAQLKSKQDGNADVAHHLHNFYLYSLAMLEPSPRTFPSTSLVRKLSQLLPLLPRAFRQTGTWQDLTDAEAKRLVRRIAKRFDLGPEPERRKRSRLVV